LACNISDFNKITRIVGYTSTTTDGGQATVQATAAINGLTFTTASNCIWENFIFDGNATGTKGVVHAGNFGSALVNCTIKNWTAEGVESSAIYVFSLTNCRVTGCAGTNGAIAVGTNAQVSLLGCTIDNNSKPGIYITSTAGIVCIRCNIYENTGNGMTVGDGAYTGKFVIYGCNFWANTSSGLSLATYAFSNQVYNNIFVANGAYGINFTGLTAANIDLNFNYNAFYNNTTANRSSNLTASPNDVTLTGDPFTNAASDDFSLNNTAGAGAACRAAGFPGVMMFGGTGYSDIGALQHQDSGGGGGGMLFIPNLEGT
jgi:hypothetical protein